MGEADVVSLIVAAMGTLAGTMNAMGWVAVLIYLFSAVGCGYFLMAKFPRLRPCENVDQRGMRRIVFSIAFSRKRLPVQLIFTSTNSTRNFSALVQR
jgi:hypothetical protein